MKIWPYLVKNVNYFPSTAAVRATPKASILFLSFPQSHFSLKHKTFACGRFFHTFVSQLFQRADTELTECLSSSTLYNVIICRRHRSAFSVSVAPNDQLFFFGVSPPRARPNRDSYCAKSVREKKVPFSLQSSSISSVRSEGVWLIRATREEHLHSNISEEGQEERERIKRGGVRSLRSPNSATWQPCPPPFNSLFFRMHCEDDWPLLRRESLFAGAHCLYLSFCRSARPQ